MIITSLKFDAKYNLVGQKSLKFAKKIHFLTTTATEFMVDVIVELPGVKNLLTSYTSNKSQPVLNGMPI